MELLNNLALGFQVYWICPLIEDSIHLDFSSVKKKYELLSKKFPNKVGLIHGALKKEEKENILRRFLKKEHSVKYKEKIFFTNYKRPNGFLFWFHVASIGEFKSILPIIEFYLKQNPRNNFLITTGTS
mgnify:CR=1 FL=1